MKRACVKCGHHWFWYLSDSRRTCRRCGQRQSFRSVWDSSRLSEATKRRLLEYFVLGVPAYRLRFRAPVSLEATERCFRLGRRVLALEEEWQQPFAGRIECDEAMFGGKRKGKRGWGAAGKVLIFGILQRNGRVKVFAVKGRGRDELLPLIREQTTPGSLYYTDDWQAYASLAVRGEHVVVTKERGRPKGRAHINGIEGFWSYAKHWLYQYRGVPKKFFHFYLAETSFRFNHRDEDLFPLALQSLEAN
jgi:transposase